MTQPKIDGVGHGIPRMLYASDGLNWYAILVDSDGHVKIDVVTYPGVNALGNIPFGYNDRYAEYIYGLSTNGDATANGTVVPAGEVWVVNNVLSCHDDSVARVVQMKMMAGATAIPFKVNRSLAQSVPLEWQGSIVLKEGDKIRVVGESLATGKYVYGWVWGYKMKVA